MKKLLALLCLLTVFTCENEPLDFDSETGETDVELFGEWNLSEFNTELTTTTDFDGQIISSDLDVSSTEVDYTLNFIGNNFTTNGNYSYVVGIVVNGTEVSNEPYTIDNVSGGGAYSVNGNQMTIDGSFFEFNFQGADTSVLDGEQTTTFQISANGETLTFTQSENTTEIDPTTGAIVTISNNSTSIWTRDEGVVVTNPCDAEEATNDAAAAYNEDNTNEDLCNAYKAALQNQIAECGDDNGSLQTIIDDLGDCTTASANGTLVVTTGTLDIEFTQQTVSIDNDLITVEGTSAGGSYMIYFQVTEGDTGTDVFQNFVLTLNGTEYFPSTQGFEDFTSSTSVSTGNVLQATFFGIVESAAGADLSLTQGAVDVTY
ncbi:hypothetical protein [Winogradskyella sp. UBA3174]|uniref:hypothetical protein n=1 Tax=Winogradskyella sp. UBA3174 TaxID=1947785 RepID=UPI0025F53209|nr:hypothetical protein [Winogradskyella sp. UBA3174]|tara:strand:- start:10335 stop:11456 length:1122 start_codon:yes stop_codon:yes gene_type:complete